MSIEQHVSYFHIRHTFVVMLLLFYRRIIYDELPLDVNRRNHYEKFYNWMTHYVERLMMNYVSSVTHHYR